MRRLLPLILVPLLAGCARPDYAEYHPDWLIITAGPQTGYAIKRVVEKHAPITLLGDDGSVCRTTSERFAATSEGAWTDCNWTLPYLDETEVASLSP
jgi:hypothetical protein